MAAETLDTRYEIMETAPDADTLPFIVSRAHDVAEERVVTLQTLPARRISAPAQRAAFVAAVQQASRLNHSNITHIYDQGDTSDGGLYLSTEYTRGITLKERIRRIAPFSLAVAADLGVAIAEALDDAHTQGVVHGDLRPHHVLLSPEGQIKVGGFCYSRAANALTGGSDPLYAAYTAPEQDGQSLPSTTSADIYALGVILFEMLTGKLPASNDPLPPSPRLLNAGIPPALEGIVQKAIHPDPALRYRSITSVLADLRSVREALRAGRSLAWSPVAEQRVPRPASPAAAPRAPIAAVPVSPTDDDPDDEQDGPVRAASRAFSIALAFLFVVAVLVVVGLSWYATRFLAIPNDVTVPNLIGRTLDEATQTAARDHFVLVQKDAGAPQYNAVWPQNQIFQQDPPANRTVKEGQSVTVAVSAGPPLLSVPDLGGMTQARATLALQDAGLPLGNVTQQYSNTIANGNVISQAPSKGAMVTRGTSVNFVVSQGVQPPDVPQNLTAQPSDSSTVTLSWDSTPRASSYTVTRVENGQSKVIATGLPADQTQIADTGLTPMTSYTYTVTAVNSGGSSTPSAPVTAETPPFVPVPPVIPPGGTGSSAAGDTGPSSTNTGNGSGAGSAPGLSPSSPGSVSGTGDTSSPIMRPFTIRFRLPDYPARQRHVQFEIQDALGLSWPYDEWRSPGAEVDSPVQVYGSHVIFRIFLDGKLVKQETL